MLMINLNQPFVKPAGSNKALLITYVTILINDRISVLKTYCYC